MRALSFIAFVALSVLASPSAEADEWRVLSGDGKTLPSDCVGKPVTPECIVDTMIACEVLSPIGVSMADEPLRFHPSCYSLGWILTVSNYDGVPHFEVRHADPQEPVTYRYRIETRTVNERDMLHRTGLDDWRLGDLAVNVWFKWCLAGYDCRGSEYPRTRFLRREKYRWTLLPRMFDPYNLGSKGGPDRWDHWNSK